MLSLLYSAPCLPLSGWWAVGDSRDHVLRGADKKKIYIQIAVSKIPDKTTDWKKSAA